jgi:hypothetical protein
MKRIAREGIHRKRGEYVLEDSSEAIEGLVMSARHLYLHSFASAAVPSSPSSSTPTAPQSAPT